MKCIFGACLLGWMVGVSLAEVRMESAVPAVAYVEAGGGQSWLILRGSGLEGIREIRSLVGGKTTDHVIGRPAPAQAGVREFVLLARPDAPRGTLELVAQTASGALAVPAQAVVVEPGDPRARAAGKPADLNQAAREARGQPIVVDREQVPQVTATVPSPLRVAPDGRPVKVQLRGKNLGRVTDVRIRKEGEEPRYRGRQGQLPFRRHAGGEGLEVDVVAGRSTPLGSRYVIDLLVEQYRAVSVPMEIGEPLPPPPAPEVETREPGAPRVIELPPQAP